MENVKKNGSNFERKTARAIIMLPVPEVRPYEKNPRKNAGAVKYVKASIEKFGFKQPIIVDSNRVIIAGHTRLEAAKSLGMAEVPCIVADDLTDAQVKALRLADNKVAEFSEWEMNLLGEELGELAEISDIDMGDFGFDMGDFGFDLSEEDETKAEVTEDEIPEKVEPVCKRGDIWQLGEHRLMCGDSTDPECFAKLMNGERADIAFTSPPYNMQASNITKAFDSDKVKDTYGIKEGTYNEFSDNLSNDDYAKLLNGALDCCLANADEVLFNIGVLAASKFGIIDMLAAHKEKFADVLVWNKNNCMPLCLPTQIHLLGHICELIFCFSQAGTRAFSHSQWELGKMNNRIDVGMQYNNEYSKVHHATFPVALPAYIIENFTEKSIIDCFGGTGTTMIAAEQLGRKCFMMELDQQYCDIIIARWEKLTGQKAVKL